MLADPGLRRGKLELAGAIGHKHRAIDEALGREVPPQCALGGDADGIVLVRVCTMRSWTMKSS